MGRSHGCWHRLRGKVPVPRLATLTGASDAVSVFGLPRVRARHAERGEFYRTTYCGVHGLSWDTIACGGKVWAVSIANLGGGSMCVCPQAQPHTETSSCSCSCARHMCASHHACRLVCPHWARAEGPVPSLADFPAKGVPHCSDTTTDQIVHAKVHAKNSSTFPCPKDLTRAAASLPVRRH